MLYIFISDLLSSAHEFHCLRFQNSCQCKNLIWNEYLLIQICYKVQPITGRSKEKNIKKNCVSVFKLMNILSNKRKCLIEEI